MFGGTTRTKYEKRTKYILKDASIIIVAFQAAQRTLGSKENLVDAMLAYCSFWSLQNKR
jgi:hypothetical protein